jgi:hypothetical protein
MPTYKKAYGTEAITSALSTVENAKKTVKDEKNTITKNTSKLANHELMLRNGMQSLREDISKKIYPEITKDDMQAIKVLHQRFTDRYLKLELIQHSQKDSQIEEIKQKMSELIDYFAEPHNKKVPLTMISEFKKAIVTARKTHPNQRSPHDQEIFSAMLSGINLHLGKWHASVIKIDSLVKKQVQQIQKGTEITESQEEINQDLNQKLHLKDSNRDPQATSVKQLEVFMKNFTKDLKSEKFDPMLDNKSYILTLCREIDKARKLGKPLLAENAINLLLFQANKSEGLLNQLKTSFTQSKANSQSVSSLSQMIEEKINKIESDSLKPPAHSSVKRFSI